MVQATAEILRTNNRSEGFMSKTAKTGFRLAEFALNASIAGLNIAESTLGTAVDVADNLMSSPSNQNQPNDNNIETISVHSRSSQTSGEVSSPPETINSFHQVLK